MDGGEKCRVEQDQSSTSDDRAPGLQRPLLLLLWCITAVCIRRVALLPPSGVTRPLY